jgi:hypothetical protein
MAGKGKYTVYVQPISERRKFLEKLYKGNSTIEPPFQGLDQAAAIAKATALGNEFLRAGKTDGIQEGDLNYLPGGSDLTFAGRKSAIQAPDTLAGKDGAWSKPGDPANSYVPDLTSPGPGKTEGTDKAVDPKIKATDVKPNFPDKGTVGTKSPVTVGPKVHAAAALGADSKPGDSGANT